MKEEKKEEINITELISCANCKLPKLFIIWLEGETIICRCDLCGYLNYMKFNPQETKQEPPKINKHSGYLG